MTEQLVDSKTEVKTKDFEYYQKALEKKNLLPIVEFFEYPDNKNRPLEFKIVHEICAQITKGAKFDEDLLTYVATKFSWGNIQSCSDLKPYAPFIQALGVEPAYKILEQHNVFKQWIESLCKES